MLNSGVRSVCAFGVAEFVKIYHLRITPVMLAVIPFATYLVAFQIYHIEHIALHQPVPNMFTVLPWVLLAIWKSFLPQLTIVCFAAYCSGVESQYGMIRVLCVQPISRGEYAIGKGLAVTAHITILTFALVIWSVIWTCLYSGLRGGTFKDALDLIAFSVALLAFTQALGWVAYGVALMRQSIATAVSTALIVVVLLALLAGQVPVAAYPYTFFRYFLFPWTYFSSSGKALSDLATSMNRFNMQGLLFVSLLTAVPALVCGFWYFAKRDITE